MIASCFARGRRAGWLIRAKDRRDAAGSVERIEPSLPAAVLSCGAFGALYLAAAVPAKPPHCRAKPRQAEPEEILRNSKVPANIVPARFLSLMPRHTKQRVMCCKALQIDICGHRTLKAPHPVRSAKLSKVSPSQYCGGGPRGNPRCCSSFLFSPSLFGPARSLARGVVALSARLKNSVRTRQESQSRCSSTSLLSGWEDSS